MARATILVLAFLAGGFAADVGQAASAARACVRDTCRVQAKTCAAAFRAQKKDALAACGATKRKNDPCRRAAKKAARDGLGDCRAAAKTCTSCCRTTATGCAVGVCGNARIEAAEECDGTARGACAGDCRSDCRCTTTVKPAICGNATIELGEDCEPGNDPACPEQCRDDCTCPPPSLCGNGSIDGHEPCDGAADAACPGECRPDCTCTPLPPPVCGNGVTDGIDECDAGDDARCPGRCRPDCTCAVCGDDVIESGEDCELLQTDLCTDVCSEFTCMCVSPTTDECTAPRRLEALPAVDHQVVVDATSAPDDPPADCLTFSGLHERSVWYVVNAPATGRIFVDTEGSTYDTVLLALTGECGDLTPVACNDDSGTERARVEFPVTAGTDYLLDVQAFRGENAGELGLNVSFRPCGDGVLQQGEACEPAIPGSCASGVCTQSCECLPPAADECADVVLATPPIDVELAAAGATANALDPRPSCVGPLDTALSAWLRFVAPADGTVIVDTKGSDYDTVVSVFEKGCGALSELACDDDDGAALTSRAFVEVTAGTTYTVLVLPYLHATPGRLHLHVAYERPSS